MSDRPPRVLRFLSAEVEHLSAERCRARVQVQQLSGEPFAGAVEGGCAEADLLRSLAQAAADAIHRAVGTDQDTIEVQGLEVKDALGVRVVFVSVLARYQGQNRKLMGFCSLDPDPHKAAALAVLNATNRFLNIG